MTMVEMTVVVVMGGGGGRRRGGEVSILLTCQTDYLHIIYRYY